MQKEVTVGIVGAGNVAWHLVKGLQQVGVNITLVYSRTLTHAQELAAQTPATLATDSLDFLTSAAADVYLVAVPDQALPIVAAQAKFPAHTLVGHTSGTQPLEVLQNLAPKPTGVFYPLQTFSKEKAVDWAQIPICVEASNPEAEETLLQLARRLSQTVVPMPGDQRKQLHLAAVFACNFTNHLWGIAQQLLQEAALPVHLLAPLVKETMDKAFLHLPFAVQTGPAQRNDVSTLQAHQQLLTHHPQYQQVYQALTQSIREAAKKV